MGHSVRHAPQRVHASSSIICRLDNVDVKLKLLVTLGLLDFMGIFLSF